LAVRQKIEAEQEAKRRIHVARRAAMTPEEQQIEDEMNEALREIGPKFFDDFAAFGNDEAYRLYFERDNAVRAEAEAKRAALSPEQRSDGKYDVEAFDFEAFDKAEREERQASWEKYLAETFPPAKEGADDASRS
jgi:hypothetical protein